MRIISGKYKGKKLANISNLLNIRPTTDFSKENLFNILCANKVIKDFGFKILDSVIADFCCGTGNIGFEAISRGAKKSIFLDNNLNHLNIVKKNAASLNLDQEIDIINSDIFNLDKNKLEKYKFDLIFIDPPYDHDYRGIMKSLFSLDIFKDNSLVIFEHRSNLSLNFNDNKYFDLLLEKKYGNSSFKFMSKVRA